MEAPEGRDVLRGVSLRASVSLHAQWEDRGGSTSTWRHTCSRLRPHRTGQDRGRGRGPGAHRVQGPRQISLTSLGLYFLILGDGNCFTNVL